MQRVFAHPSQALLQNLSTRYYCRLTYISETYLAPRVPGKLDICGSYRLRSRQVDRCLVAFVGKGSVHLKILSDPLDRLESYVIQGGSILSGRCGDKIFGGLLISRPDLQPLITAQVI